MSIFQRRTKGATEFLRSANTASRPYTDGSDADPYRKLAEAAESAAGPDPTSIIELLGRHGGMQVAALAKEFGVSENELTPVIQTMDGERLIERFEDGLLKLSEIGLRALKYSKIAKL